ncbi:hypothetical protein CLV30_106160 [Haloactinopolyspora alba]|uniref:Uncharacterized protein n=1 Tax=Haloactinopolyspora alba TaxID=648780 RepID=A0A2P8E3V5_9ACTN|nr:hypothetical protein [Haloactinopolyspora alba]PSL04155.1 hypothetical protein CLV30_106160 [Haloactinopolyspora alba]
MKSAIGALIAGIPVTSFAVGILSGSGVLTVVMSVLGLITYLLILVSFGAYIRTLQDTYGGPE